MNPVHRVKTIDAMNRLTLSVTLLVCWGSSLTSLAQEPRFVAHSLLIASE